MIATVITYHHNNHVLGSFVQHKMPLHYTRCRPWSITSHSCTTDHISTHSLLGGNSTKWQVLDWTIYELPCHIISKAALSVRCWLSTLQHVTFVIRLPWHFPDGSWKMSETEGWLNGFYPLLQVWCFLIDRLIPWRNWMCHGRRLMEQMETCIPPTPYLSLNSPAHGLHRCPSLAALSIFCFASLATFGLGWKVKPHIRFVFMFFLKRLHYSLPPAICETER